MLNEVETEITINYDCDVLLNPETYIKAENKILNENFDLVYPYGFEQNDQRLIPNTTEHRYNLNISNPSLYKTALCRYGHVQFFKTKSYRQGFMENEHYRHWCPEDVERCIRFQKLGYNVCWMPGTLIFHLEHPPSFKEPFVNKYEIMKLHNFLISLSKEKLYEYYKNQTQGSIKLRCEEKMMYNCVEKYLKACLQEENIAFGRTHDLTKLLIIKFLSNHQAKLGETS